MKRYMKKVFLIMAAVYMLPGLLYADAGRLKGAWQCSDGYGNRTFLKFLDKRVLEYDGERMNYRATNDAILIQNDYGMEDVYRYGFKKKTLTILFPDTTQINCTQVVQNSKKSKKASSSAGGAFIIGPLCSWSGSSSSYSGSSYSNSRRIYFDANGNFSINSETSFSSNAGNYYNQGGNPDSSGTYTIEGNTVLFLLNNGSSIRMNINIKQNSGEITELMYGKILYAKSLCE